MSTGSLTALSGFDDAFLAIIGFLYADAVSYTFLDVLLDALINLLYGTSLEGGYITSVSEGFTLLVGSGNVNKFSEFVFNQPFLGCVFLPFSANILGMDGTGLDVNFSANILGVCGTFGSALGNISNFGNLLAVLSLPVNTGSFAPFLLLGLAFFDILVLANVEFLGPALDSVCEG